MPELKPKPEPKELKFAPPKPDPAADESKQCYVKAATGRLWLEGSPGELRAMFEEDYFEERYHR